VLASATVTGGTPYEERWFSVPFSSPATVVAGTKYAIVAISDDASYAGWTVVHDAYAGGGAYASSPTRPWSLFVYNEYYHDAAFKTYVVVPPRADLSLTISRPSTATSKSQVTYVLTVRNAGPQTATNVVLTDYLPYGTQFTSIGTSQGSCTPPSKGGAAKVTCNLGDIASGGGSSSGVTLKITARSSQSNINNVASVASDLEDPNTLNNSASFTTQIVK